MDIVKFPNLGIWFNLDPVAIKINLESINPDLSSINIYWYGILIATSFLTAIVLALRQCESYDITQDNFIDTVLWAAPLGIVGARLYYVIFSWSNYKDDLTEIFKIWHGGLAIYGGIIFGILTAVIYAKVKKIPMFKLLDFAVVYIPLAQAIGRWGNFVNQEAFGTNTTLPWGMTSDTIKDTLSSLKMQGLAVDPTLPVHPTFLYESLWDFAIFWILLSVRKCKKANGEVVYLYLALYGIGRFFIETLRTDSLMAGNLRVSQMLSALLVVVFASLFIYTRRKTINIDEALEIGNSEYANVLKMINEKEAPEMFESTTNVNIVENDIPKEVAEGQSVEDEALAIKSEPKNSEIDQKNS